jgi:hypothetical protein
MHPSINIFIIVIIYPYILQSTYPVHSSPTLPYPTLDFYDSAGILLARVLARVLAGLRVRACVFR